MIKDINLLHGISSTVDKKDNEEYMDLAKQRGQKRKAEDANNR